VGIKTKLNAKLAIRQRADLSEANMSANKISLSQGQSYTEREPALTLRKANFVSKKYWPKKNQPFTVVPAALHSVLF